jgi:hypothetical protein
MARVWLLAIAPGIISLAPILVLSLEGISGISSSAYDKESLLQRRPLGSGFLSRDISNLFQPSRSARNGNITNANTTITNATDANATTTWPAIPEIDNLVNQSDGSSSETGSPTGGGPIQIIPPFIGTPEGIPEQLDCGFTFNVSEEGCAKRIAVSSRDPGECDCYSFCGEALRGCYMRGEATQFFECFIEDIVIGCKSNNRRDGIEAAVKVPVDTPCPAGYLCSLYGQTSCEEVRRIPMLLGLGDIHAGMYCP